MLRTDERNQNPFVYDNDMSGNWPIEDDKEALSGPIVLLEHRGPSSPSLLQNYGILLDERRESHTRAVPISDWVERSPVGVVKSAHMELQANQNSSFFHSASNFEVVGSQFTSFRDHISTGNVFISVHPGSNDTISVHPRSDKVEISHLKGPMPMRKSSEIYYRHLLTLGHGSPLWIPEPSNSLPIEYQKAGIGIGDVGILKDSGGFDFLFNLYQPHNNPEHTINPREMPPGFWPLDPPDKRDVDSHTVFKSWSCLTSSHVHSHQDGSSGFVFESSAEDGAILTMPNGANSMDLDNMAAIRKYVSMNVKQWYMYANEVRGRNARKGDLRLVIGKTSATTWGMATFTNEAVLKEGAASRLKFKTISRNIRGCASPWYTWEYSGQAEVKAGPDEQEVEKLREFDRLKGEDGQIEYQNQCLFLRTINVMLGDAVHPSHDSHTPQRFEDMGRKIAQPRPPRPRGPRPLSKLRRPSRWPAVTSPLMWSDDDPLPVDTSSQPDHRPILTFSPSPNSVSASHNGTQSVFAPPAQVVDLTHPTQPPSSSLSPQRPTAEKPDELGGQEVRPKRYPQPRPSYVTGLPSGMLKSSRSTGKTSPSRPPQSTGVSNALSLPRLYGQTGGPPPDRPMARASFGINTRSAGISRPQRVVQEAQTLTMIPRAEDTVDTGSGIELEPDFASLLLPPSSYFGDSSVFTPFDSDSDSTTEPWAIPALVSALHQPDAAQMASGSRRPSGSPSPPNSDADFARVAGQPLNGDLHPSRVINEFLLRSVPGASMAITEDRDWISVLQESDQVFPSDDVLLSRIKDMYVVCEEEGVVFLQRGRGGAI